MSQAAVNATVVTQPKFKSILFPTDFSPCSEEALPYVRSIAERYGSTVHIVNVAKALSVAGELTDPSPYPEDNDKAILQKMEMITSGALKNIPHTEAIQKGEVWDVVSELISDLYIDLIVIATHGHGGVKHLVLGSVAEEIFRRASCPVLTVGPDAHKNGSASGQFATILYATDLSPASHHSVGYALGLASAAHSKVNLLHVLSSSESPSTHLDKLIESSKKQLANLIPGGTAPGDQVLVERGRVAETILKVAADTKSNLIVMSVSEGALTSAQSRAPWTIAHQVVCHAPCPVLTVRS